jgi:hypothetical protein
VCLKPLEFFKFNWLSGARLFTLHNIQLLLLYGVQREVVWYMFIQNIATYLFLKHPVLPVEATLNHNYPR